MLCCTVAGTFCQGEGFPQFRLQWCSQQVNFRELLVETPSTQYLAKHYITTVMHLTAILSAFASLMPLIAMSVFFGANATDSTV